MIEAWAFWLAVAFAIVLAVILLVKIVVGWWHGSKGKRRLEGANRALVAAAYNKAGVVVEARVKIMQAEAQAEEARQAKELAKRLLEIFEEDASGDPPPGLQLP